MNLSKLVEFKKLNNEATLKIENSNKKKVFLRHVSKERKQTGSGVHQKLKDLLKASFNIQARGSLNCEIARMFYSSRLAFHLVRSPYYRSAFCYAYNTSNLSGYVPPSYNKLRGPLLEKERSHVENLLQPIRNSWKQKGVTIVRDGGSDLQRRPIITFMAINESGPMFLKSIDEYGEIKDNDFIVKHMRDVIMEVGPKNVVKIIGDNATICKTTSIIIESQFSSIYWTPCVVHTLNLALKNICSTKNTERNNDLIKNFLGSHKIVVHLLKTSSWDTL